MKKLLNSGPLEGLDRNYTDDEVKAFVCDACLSSKAHREPFENSVSHATSPLQLVLSDVLSFPTPLSLKSFIVTFIDDYSRKLWGYATEIRAMCSKRSKHGNVRRKPLQNTVNTLRPINGGEYTSTSFNTFCIDHGNHRGLTIHYTPQQYGRA